MTAGLGSGAREAVRDAGLTRACLRSVGGGTLYRGVVASRVRTLASATTYLELELPKHGTDL